MQKTLLSKLLIVGLMLVLIGVALSMVNGIVRERQSRQAEAVRDIANSYAGSQKLVGPVLVIPYHEIYSAEEVVTDAGGIRHKQTVEKKIERAFYLMPNHLQIASNLAAHEKHRGLFKTMVYGWNGQMQGQFVLPEKIRMERSRNDSRLQWGESYLAIGLGDTRGLTGTPQVEWNGRKIKFEKGSGIAFMNSGIHAPLGVIEPGKELTLSFKLDFSLNGTAQLAVVPLADNNQVEIASKWPHPSFAGRFLPDAQNQKVGPEGFAARWSVSALASNAGQQFLSAAAKPERCAEGSCLEALEIRLSEPVNIYTQSDRALKYGFLFVGLSFAAFFLFEIMKRLPIHPAQYFLVGLALALFFLLVLSLSEHIVFAQAYLVAASASVALIAYYLAHVLRSLWRGAGFGAMLGLLFATLYTLLISEDNALMLGSLLLFILLAITMVATRRLDWYRLGPATPAESAEASA